MNGIQELENQIERLQHENRELKRAIDYIHKSWKYDSDRYQELKREYKSLIDKYDGITKMPVNTIRFDN